MKTSARTPAACLFIAVILAAVCPSLADDKPTQPDVAFFTKLRMDYAKRPDFNTFWKLDEQREAVFTAYKAKDYAKVVTLSKAWLEKCPVDADVHYIRSQALAVQGDITHYAYESYYFYGLIQSIASSGDGMSEKTAFKVISIEEEYYLLNGFGAKLIQQSLQGHCDVMQCKLPDGTEATYYFDASIPLAAEAKAFDPKK